MAALQAICRPKYGRLPGGRRSAGGDELERSWHVRAFHGGGRRVLLDLSDVTFVDAEGKKLLGSMRTQGAQFLIEDCLTEWLVEEITRPSSSEQ